MNDILYLEPDDEITVVIDRLKTCRSAAIVLVIPRGSVLAQSIVNLKILKRNAEELDREIFLVTNDRITRNIASQIGITVYSKVAEAERAKPQSAPVVQRGIGLHKSSQSMGDAEGPSKSSVGQGGFKVNSYARYKADVEPESTEDSNQDEKAPEDGFVSRKISVPINMHVDTAEDDEPEISEEADGYELSNSEAIEQEEIAEKIDHRKVAPMNYKKVHNSRRVLLVIFAVVLIIGLAFGYVFLPYASASVQLKTQDYTKEFEAQVSRTATEIDPKNAIVPGSLVTVEREETKQFASTGTKEIGDKATGKMTISNGYDTSSHKYAKGTRFTSQGKAFLADSDFSVDAATLSLSGGNVNITPGTGTVTVTAEEAGESYNLAAGNYVIVGAPSKITAKGSDMSGGTTKQLKVVTDKDLSDAEASLKNQVTESTKNEIKDKATASGAVLLLGSLVSEVLSESHSKDAEAEADGFDFTIKIKTFTLSFNERDLRSMATAMISDEIKANQMLVNPDKSELTYELKESDRNVELAKLKVTFKGKVAPKMEESTVKSLIRNRSLSGAIASLKTQDTVLDAKIDVWPTFLGRTPMIVNRLKVQFDYAK